MTLGERIRQLRKERGWTLSDLSVRSGLTISFHSDIERDRTEPSLRTLVKIAGAFDMKVIHLLVGVDLGETEGALEWNS